MSAAEHKHLNGKDPARPGIVLRSALEIAHRPQRANWLLKPLVPRGALVLLYGAEGTYKSFLALDWALQIAAKGEPAVFLHAEGRGLWKRLRAWAMFRNPSRPWAQTLNGLPFLAVERPLNLSADVVMRELNDAIHETGRKPALVVVDTISRNSDGAVERSNEDANMYLNGLDHGIRARYGASVILVHHIGHAARDRARGPFTLTGSTDANFRLERPDLTRKTVNVLSGRMKDCEPPPPFELEAEIVTLDELDDEGIPETSLVLRATGASPVLRQAPTGKAQRQLLAELERRAAEPGSLAIWPEAELRAIARGLGLHRNTARDAVLGLRQLGYFQSTVGGSRLAHQAT